MFCTPGAGENFVMMFCSFPSKYVFEVDQFVQCCELFLLGVILHYCDLLATSLNDFISTILAVRFSLLSVYSCYLNMKYLIEKSILQVYAYFVFNDQHHTQLCRIMLLILQSLYSR